MKENDYLIIMEGLHNRLELFWSRRALLQMKTAGQKIIILQAILCKVLGLDFKRIKALLSDEE
ncbi:hypothetical protein ACT7CZ_19715 [Bacillus cereus]